MRKAKINGEIEEIDDKYIVPEYICNRTINKIKAKLRQKELEETKK